MYARSGQAHVFPLGIVPQIGRAVYHAIHAVDRTLYVEVHALSRLPLAQRGLSNS